MQGKLQYQRLILLAVLLFSRVSHRVFENNNPPHSPYIKQSITLQSDSLTPICQIQGNNFSSPYENQIVYVQGTVTADFDEKRGLFAIQDDQCDTNPKTSNAIWVYFPAKAEIVKSGDKVEVHGTVVEYYGRTEINTTYDKIWVLSSNNPLPTALELTPPQDNGDSNYYFENREAMLVQIPLAQVVGPTDSYRDTYVIPSTLGLTRMYQGDLLGNGGILVIDDSGLFKLDSPLKVGDQISEIIGILDEAYQAYRIYLLQQPQLLETPYHELPHAHPLPSTPSYRLATFNLANLYDMIDDPAINDIILSKPEYQRRLQKRALTIANILGEPELIALQEAENQAVLLDLIHQLQISSPYEIVWKNSADPRGLDTALLYRTDHIFIDATYQEQGCTTLIDGLGPDGNQDVKYPANNLTCDTNGDGSLDGNRLFSREPLIVFFHTISPKTQAPVEQTILIINHWKSKVEDTPWQLYTLARRQEEARYVAELVQNYRDFYPDYAIIVVGDLNDTPDSPPLQELKASGLSDLTLMTDDTTHYSYVYHGISQVTDYILADLGKYWRANIMEPIHINADYPYKWSSADATPIRSSDHDLWQAIFERIYSYYIPLVITKR